MNNKALKTLEFNKIITKLEHYAGSDAAKTQCGQLKPYTSIEEIKLAQTHTNDALSRITRKGPLKFDGVYDIQDSLVRLEIGSVLGTGELLRIKSVLSVANAAKQYSYVSADSKDIVFDDSLNSLFESIEPLTYIRKDIERCIIAEDEIADDASINLKNIRRKIKIAEDRIHTDINSYVNSSASSYLQDSIVTMRDGRYCVPVKAEYRSQVDGVVHDQSSTGSTVFVEPKIIVDLNNKIGDLKAKEAEEIQLILANLSLAVSEHISEIKQDIEALTTLDFIFAKGMLAREMKAVKPVLNQHGYINIKQGRHPLLDAEKVVPIDVYLGKDFDLLVVTGPNTGGKTVSLKTVGLLTLMGQAGLHIPADETSEIAVFDQVFADIGDEQSIEQSLSTFSSHMVNIVDILDQATANSLILFDEIGAGTDPTEGAALAISILSTLHKRGARIMATTHYSELKLYALQTKGVSNASCEFDVETLRPTYKLLIGLPGKSNAFAISSKLGLDDSIIADAKTRIDEDDEKFEDVLTQIENKRQALEKDRASIEALKDEIATLKKHYANKVDSLTSQKERIISEAKDEAAKILKEAKTTADTAIANIHKYGKNANLKEMEKSRTKIGSSLKDVQAPSIKRGVQTKQYKPSDFKLGTGVKVLSLNLKGTVASLPNKNGDLTVKMGILNSNVNIKDLEIIDEPDIKAPGLNRSSSGKIKMKKALNISTEVNLIGKTSSDAISTLEKYLDDAYIAHLHEVRIIHGKGTGTLRKAVQNYLKTLSYIDSYRDGNFGEGGAGVTIATFK